MKAEGRKEYEISYLLTTPEAEQEVVSVLKENGAEITHQKSVASITLAYSIKKHATAYFGFCHFTAEPAEVKLIHGTLQLKKTVLRFLILTPPVKIPVPRVMPGQAEVAGRPATASKPERKAPASTTLSNEALSEKLEEILK